MIKAVIFDFFGVLVTEGFKLFCDTYFPNDKQKRRKALQLVNKHDSGLLSMEEFFAGMADLAGIDYSSAAAINSNRANVPLINYIKQELKSKYKLGVLSNSGDDYISRMLDPADVKMFDDVVLSYQHGIVKPEQKIFEMAAERLGVGPNEAVFIDDSPKHVEGAYKAGMKAVLYKDFNQMKGELEKVLASGSNN